MNILDKNFRYTSAAATDIRKTFRKEQKRLSQQADERRIKDEALAAQLAKDLEERERKVRPLSKKRAAG